MSSLKSIAAQAVESAGIPQPAQSVVVTSQSTTLSQPDSRGMYHVEDMNNTLHNRRILLDILRNNNVKIIKYEIGCCS